MGTYPTSPKEMTSGMLYFPRMLEKIQLHARGELHEDYHDNLGAPRTLEALAAIFYASTMTIFASASSKEELTKKSLSGVFKAAGSRMRGTCLSGMDSCRNSDGAIL
jgi:hypothetical protein